MKSVKLKTKSTIVLLLIFSLIFSLSACGEKNFVEHSFYDFLGTSVSVVIDADATFFWQKNKLNKCYDEIDALLERIDGEFSVENEDSFVSKFNSLKSGEKIETNEEFAKVFGLAKSYYESTEKAFNPSVKLLVDLWGFSKRYSEIDYQPTFAFDRERNENGGFNLPSSEFQNAFVSLAELDAELDGVTLTKTHSSIKIGENEFFQQMDLSGLVKGYVADLIKDVITDNGFTDFYVSIGTSSMYLSKNGDEPFKLEVTNPENPTGNGIVSLNVENKAVSTSGVYENNYIIGDKNYHHIIDTLSGAPAETDILSVTLLGDDGAKLDAFSTALVVMGSEKAIECANSEGFLFVIVKNDKKVLTNLGENLTLINQDYAVIQR